jgi:hypothetical protein
MLYRGVIAICSEIHTQHINSLCGQNVKFVNVKILLFYEVTVRSGTLKFVSVCYFQPAVRMFRSSC